MRCTFLRGEAFFVHVHLLAGAGPESVSGAGLGDLGDIETAMDVAPALASGRPPGNAQISTLSLELPAMPFALPILGDVGERLQASMRIHPAFDSRASGRATTP